MPAPCWIIDCPQWEVLLSFDETPSVQRGIYANFRKDVIAISTKQSKLLVQRHGQAKRRRRYGMSTVEPDVPLSNLSCGSTLALSHEERTDETVLYVSLVLLRDSLSPLNSLQVPFASAAADRAALETFFRVTNGANWRVKINWNTDAELARWYGVEVDHIGRVVKLYLPENLLEGMPSFCVLFS